MKKFLLFLVLFFSFTSFGYPALQNANPQGKLAVHVAVASSPDYISEWISTDHTHNVYIKSLKEVMPEQTAYLSVIVTGYGIDQNNYTDLTADFVLQNPDGSIQFEEEGIFSHKQDMRNSNHTGFVMLNPALDLVLEENDLPGEYKIVILVHDGVIKKAAIGEYHFILKKE